MVAKTQFSVIDDNIIVAKLSGAYSSQAGLELYKSFRELVETQSGSFAIIMELTDFQGSTPEGYQEAERFNQWLLNKPVLAKLNVRASGITQKIVEQQIPTRKKLNAGEFNSLDSAIAHIRSQYTV